jgi:hypothetical protein
MRFHFSSFLIGVAVGAGAVVVGRHMRPVAVELASAAYQISDALASRVAMMQEDFEDMMAEVRARARRQAEEARASA